MNLLENLARASLLFSLWLLVLTADLGAAERGQTGVQLKIDTILASNQNDDFDPRLSGMKNQLAELKYRSYRLLKEETQKVPWQANATFDIPRGRVLGVVPQEYRNDRVSLKVRLLEGDKPLLDTTLTIRNRRNFLLAGPAHEGGVLILSISVTTQ